MKNLKKTLAVVLAFAMVFSMGIINTFAAYSDVEAGTVVDEAVGILSNLKILEGFEDGTFKPEETVTRAQMAAIICRTLGYESQAQSSKGTTAFTDVAADSWASGYINVAQAQGIINGYGNGMFGPNDKVTYEQAVKMIVAALGYDIVAAAKGGYPTGYLAIASAEGITKNANGRVGDAALRSTVAVLVYNALEVRLMDQNSWSTDGSDTYKKTDATILSQYLRVNKWEGTLVADAFTGYAANGYDEDEVEKISLGNDAEYKVYVEGVLTPKSPTTEISATNVNASLVDTTGLLGKKVVAYIGTEEDPETDDIMVYALNEKSRANTSLTLNYLQLDKENEKKADKSGVIYYTEPGSSKVKDLELNKNKETKAIDVTVINNYVEDTTPSVVDTSTLLAEFTAKGGVVEFVNNDTDKDYDVVIVRKYDREYTVESVTEKEGVFSYKNYGTAASVKKIDTTKEDQLHIVYKDGELAEVKDIEANNTVSTVKIYDTNGNKVYMYFVSSKTVTGSVESYDDEVVVINGEEYQLDMTDKEPKNLANKEGIFFLDVDGRIAWCEADAVKSGTYGVVLALVQGKDFDAGVYEAKVALADGTVGVYELSKNAKYYDVNDDPKTDTAQETADKIATIINGGTEATVAAGTSFMTTYKNANLAMFKIAMKDDKIASFTEIENGVGLVEKTGVYDADDNSYGTTYFADDAIVFAFDANEDDKDKEGNPVNADSKKLAVGAVSAFFTDKDTNKVFYVINEEDDEYADVVLGFKLVPGVPENGALVVVTGRKVISYNDDEAVQITGIQAGEEVTYTIYGGDNGFETSHDGSHDGCKDGDKCGLKSLNNPKTLKKGDVILVSTPSAEGVVSNYRLVFNADGYNKEDIITSSTKASKAKDVFTEYRELTDVTENRFFLKADADETTKELLVNANGDKYVEAIEDGFKMTARANYTLVDFTESKTNPEITSEDASVALEVEELEEDEAPTFTTKVLVRIYDNKIVDVVAYRYKYVKKS